MDDDTKKRKEDIRRLEMTLEQLKLTLERAERQAKEEMERIGPVDEGGVRGRRRFVDIGVRDFDKGAKAIL